MGDDTFEKAADRLQITRFDRRKLIKGAAAVGASATLLGGAGFPAVIRAQDNKAVTFWTGHVDPDLTVLRSIVDAFNKENPGTTVTLTQIPPADVTDVTKLMTAVRGGTGPDVYMLDRFIVAQRAADGLLTDLTQMLGGMDVNQTYLEFAAAEAQFDGKTYALPFDTDARAIYYNKKLLNDAGVNPADLDAANGPITLDKLKEIAAKCDKTDAAGNFTQMGFVPWFDQGWHYGYGFSFGGTFFDAATCAVTPDQPQIVQAFQWVYDYSKALDPQKVQAFIQAAMKPGAPPQEHPFVQGRLAMVLTGDWFIGTLAKYAPDIDYGITYMPVPKQGDQSVTWAGGWSMVMPQGAKEPEAALKFMQYIAGEPGQRVYTKETQHMPTVKTLLTDASLFDERHQIFTDLLPTAKNRPPLPVGALYWDELTAAWQKTYLNQDTPDKLLKEVKDRVQPRLQRFCPIESS